MPYEIIYDEQTASAILKSSGVVTNEELLNGLTELFADERFSSLKYITSDRTECLKYDLDVPTINKSVEMGIAASKQNPSLLWALVSPQDVEYGISRMFEMLTDGVIKARVCRTIPEAEKWIEEELSKA